MYRYKGPGCQTQLATHTRGVSTRGKSSRPDESWGDEEALQTLAFVRLLCPVVRRLPCVVVRVHCEGVSDEGRKLRCSFALAVVLLDLTN